MRGTFANISVDLDRHEDLLRQAQRLRGSVYLQDGAIDESHLTADGLHLVQSDRSSWHFLVMDEAGRVCGCVRYKQHPFDAHIGSLGILSSSLANCSIWGDKLRAAVNEELAVSRTLQIPFIEVGGWALAEEIRHTTEALRMVLAVYGFSREFGGAVGLATATTRHGSASILRRIGGRSLTYEGQDLPTYQDPQYSCAMEVLRFYSWAPNPRYDVWVNEIARELSSVEILCTEHPGLLVSAPEQRVRAVRTQELCH